MIFTLCGPVLNDYEKCYYLVLINKKHICENGVSQLKALLILIQAPLFSVLNLRTHTVALLGFILAVYSGSNLHPGHQVNAITYLVGHKISRTLGAGEQDLKLLLHCMTNEA